MFLYTSPALWFRKKRSRLYGQSHLRPWGRIHPQEESTMKPYWRPFTGIAVLLCFALLAMPAVAQQSTGTIQGVITDQTGAVIPGATVEARSTALIGHKTTTTDNGGFFKFVSLPPGTYTVNVSAPNFAPATHTHLQVTAARVQVLDFKLVVGSAAETVEVSGEASLVETTESRVQSIVTNEVITAIPKGRSYQSLIAFAPGARAEPLQGGSSAGQNAANVGYQIDGASNSENAYLVEGMDTSGIQTGRSGINVPFEFIQELQITSSGFQAEHGGALGGVVNVVQKRGGNDWHGQVLLHYRSDRLSASERPLQRLAISGALPPRAQRPLEYYQPKEDRWRVLEPGFEVGGAVWRDRLWVFSSYIPRLETNTRTVNFTNVPAPAPPVSDRSFRYTDTTHHALNRVDFLAHDKVRVFGAWQYAFRRVVGSQRPAEDAVNNAALSQSLGSANPSAVQNPTVFLQDAGFVAPNSVFTTGADITLSPRAVATTRFGYWFNNYGDRGLPVGINYNYGFGTAGVTDLAGNPIEPQVAPQFRASTGFSSLGAGAAANLTTFFDAYKRHTFTQDFAYYTRTPFGTHNFKVGYGFNRLANNVLEYYNDARVFTFWGLGWGSTVLPQFQPNCDAIDASNMTNFGNIGDGCQGTHGFFIVRDFQTQGAVQTYNHSLYFQDNWTVGHGLTLNLGVRFDKETLPSYNGAPTVDFGFSDKVAPRIGAAWDVMRNGKWKIYGSWGWFYDIMKFELPRGSFGGDYWHDCVYALDTPNLAAITPVRTAPTAFAAAGTNCPAVGHPNPFGANARFIEEIDWRVNANDPGPLAGFPFGIAKDIKPMRQAEYVVGTDYAINRQIGVEVRYARKRLHRTIEDIGFESPAGEFYFIGNPGEAQEVAAYWASICPACNALPKAVRNYDGVEFRVTKRYSGNWYGTASYTWSRLYGNYSGLTSTDESGRPSPNVNRFFDLPHMSFTSHGVPNLGPLATDRPHTFKAFGYYALRWLGMETMIGATQSLFSGTPISTRVGLVSSWSGDQFVEGRGNFQELIRDPVTGLLSRGNLLTNHRTERFAQTDLVLQHEVKLSKTNEALRLAFEGNVENLFNQRHVLRVHENIMANAGSQYLSNVSLSEATTTGYDWVAKFNSAPASRRFTPAYGQPNLFQAPRFFRLAVRFKF
jgi:hypothetical protein